ncbi:MAG: ATP-binding cassette domain-containing protein [Spirochaetales bacterium]|uniref:ATP-binding cassette domain-containing protein n=1 Tax=Candidatus Thalassospirochaeta sargassi TaxID=3119039 RepID=A0AAJ1ICS8_9SPIO|nr:ATP-binding cassette domain-containing protein [Spirochaetales bacterium]
MISIENLVKDYGDTRALDGINVEIPRGQVIGLLGPNGAGKSTTLRILTGFIPPSSGSIRVKGLDVTEHPTEVKKMIGYLPESAPLYSEMLVYDYLNYIADIRGIRQKADRIIELSELCGITNVMHRPVRNLSKGYKQRVGLAQALMADPEILVLDEPTSGLDPNQIVEIRSIIREIGKEKTVIFSTHILSEAEAACSRVVIINKGSVAADGSTEMLKNAEEGGRSLELLIEGPSEKDAESFFGAFDDVSLDDIFQNGDGLKAVINCKNDIRKEIYLKLKDTDWILLEMVQKKQSLENIFRVITREGE